MRSLGAYGGANDRGQRLPLSGDAAHAFAPRALGDPDAVVATDSAILRPAGNRSLVGRTRLDSEGRPHRPETGGVVPVVGE